MHLGIIKITYNRTAQPRCYHNAFYGRPFREPRRGGNSDFAMTIWSASESATVCFVISLSICYWLFKCRVFHVVCVWERARERESHITASCVCSHVWERETRSHNRGLFANTYEHHHCVCHATLFPFRTWPDDKTKDIINLSLHLFWKLKLVIMERGITFPTSACAVRPITMHCASWPIRADCACRNEGLCRKRSVWERWGIEDLQ